MDDTDNYFCVDGNTGDIFLLGNHGDIIAAADTAQSIGLNPVWIFGQECATHWLQQLTRHLSSL